MRQSLDGRLAYHHGSNVYLYLLRDHTYPLRLANLKTWGGQRQVSAIDPQLYKFKERNILTCLCTLTLPPAIHCHHRLAQSSDDCQPRR